MTTRGAVTRNSTGQNGQFRFRRISFSEMFWIRAQAVHGGRTIRGQVKSIVPANFTAAVVCSAMYVVICRRQSLRGTASCEAHLNRAILFTIVSHVFLAIKLEDAWKSVG